jgi:hypothetical protein
MKPKTPGEAIALSLFQSYSFLDVLHSCVCGFLSSKKKTEFQTAAAALTRCCFLAIQQLSHEADSRSTKVKSFSA